MLSKVWPKALDNISMASNTNAQDINGSYNGLVGMPVSYMGDYYYRIC